MPYQLTHRPDHTVEVTAHADSETVEAERLHILQELRRSARIPGFRPGKAPLSVVRTRFGDTVQSELEEHLSKHLWQEVLDGEEGLEPLTPLQVKSAVFEEDGSFAIDGELEVRPRFELPSFEGLTLPEVTISVTDGEIEQELEKLRKEQAAWEPVENGAAEDGMLVEMDLHGEYVDGDGEPFSSEGVRFELGEEGVFMEIQEALRGAKSGDEVTAERQFPEDDPDRERASKTVRYRINVLSLKRQILPDIDDGFATGFGFDDLEGLTTRVREAVLARKKSERRSTWRRALLDRLEEGIDHNQLPPTLVRHDLREEMERYAYAMAMQGKDPRSDDTDWQQISAELEPQVRRKVLDSLILDQLGEEWETEVPEEEVDGFVREDAQRRGVPLAEHIANLEKEGRLDEIRRAARVSATVDELIRRAGGEVE